MKVQDLYREYRRLSDITNRYADIFLLNPESVTETAEEIFDKVYKEEHKTFLELIYEVQRLTKVDKETAKAMIHSEKFESLMSKTII